MTNRILIREFKLNPNTTILAEEVYGPRPSSAWRLDRGEFELLFRPACRVVTPSHLKALAKFFGCGSRCVVKHIQHLWKDRRLAKQLKSAINVCVSHGNKVKTLPQALG